MIALKCISCGAPLPDNLKCEYCGTIHKNENEKTEIARKLLTPDNSSPTSEELKRMIEIRAIQDLYKMLQPEKSLLRRLLD